MKKDNPFDTEVEEYEKWFKTNDKLLASELVAIRELLPVLMTDMISTVSKYSLS